MQPGQPETVTFVPVKFTEEEWALLRKKVSTTEEVAPFIHEVVMRSLRRKARKTKEDV